MLKTIFYSINEAQKLISDDKFLYLVQTKQIVKERGGTTSRNRWGIAAKMERPEYTTKIYKIANTISVKINSLVDRKD
jgi:hypothetical protein